jgi:hypothetical protein
VPNQPAQLESQITSEPAQTKVITKPPERNTLEPTEIINVQAETYQ